ncbi:ABC-type branched-chain amino acid transport system, ATPase component [Herbaspirillum sp. CF444]|uniref:branched-chain amino acid ABC transporter ATP-binding protein/permease n=1 Tax=Herbaspirillum sp. CF444 TaxID=1144319 RepID=UPI000272846C|nr:ATP-binding cassette domain-containing protein [Herbaspirillum sp. CF444]EJL81569.1 ABC-type branched-chain amino acid transport system, ATPase component [Herbaspirillum sp. CF444]
MINASSMRQTEASKSLLPVAGVAIAALVLVAVMPSLLDTYLLNILIRAFCFAMVALTVDILWGYTGVLTFGQSAFFGIGAYAAGLVFTHMGFSPTHAWLALGIAVAGAAAVAVLVGWLSFYQGATPLYASVISLVLPIVMTQLLFSGGTFTGSSSGLTGYTMIDLSLEAWFWIAGVTLVLVTAAAWVFVHSDAGKILIGIRDNESRCEYLGINPSLVKIGLLAVTAVVASVAGFGYASFSGVVAPELSGFVFGTEIIIWVALGGRGTLIGPVLGAIFIETTSAYLSGSLPFLWKLLVGVGFVLVIILLPQGLMPLALRLRRFLPRRLAGGVNAMAPTLLEAPGQKPHGIDRSTPAMRLEHVAKNFGSLKVLEGIDIVAYPGELVSLVGPNGAGKTTLMRCMSDGAERTSGIIRINEHDIRRLPAYRCVGFGIGRKFQTANVFESLTVAECLRIARAKVERPSLLRQKNTLSLPSYALAVLRATELDRKLDQVCRNLSHGEQQALELAMVLALEPRVILLDEPTAGLTKAERTKIGHILIELSRDYGLCCLLVEHDLDFVCEISSRVVVLHQGKIVMQGTVEEVVESELVQSVYAGNATPVSHPLQPATVSKGATA